MSCIGRIPVIHNVPYMRIQGGANGIILDPAIGDIGIATVCDRVFAPCAIPNGSDMVHFALK